MRIVVLGLLLFGFTGYVGAHDLVSDQKGWIVGAGYGSAMLSTKPIRQPGFISGKENTSVITVFGGYNFRDWFGIEFDFSRSSDFTDENTNLNAYILGSSFTPKFTYHFNDNLGLYVKYGFQYLAYEQNVDYYYDDTITWNGVDRFFGAGLQYSFHSGVRARIDYKYIKLPLDRSENSGVYGYDFYNEEIDLTFKAVTLSANYQF